MWKAAHALKSLVAFVVPALGGIVLLLTAPMSGRDRARNRATQLVGTWGCALAGIRLDVHDPHGHADGLRPAVVVFNHASGVDPVILCRVLKRDVVGVAKRELRSHPLLGPLLRLGDTVFVHRNAGTGGQLDAARPALARGLAVAIAPSGHRSRTPGQLHPGALALARRAGVPILPVIIRGSADILPPGALIMRAGEVRVDVLTPQRAETLTLEALERLFHERR